MKQFLLSLPRWLFVLAILCVALLFIVLFNPPHSKCDSQFEALQKSQTPFLFTDPKAKFQKRTGYDKALEMCKQGNSPGACHDLFQGLKNVIRDIDAASIECHAPLVDHAPLSKLIPESLDLMVRLAWGEKAPDSVYTRLGWLDTSHMALFCELKRIYIEAFGEDAWSSSREKIMKELPNPISIGRNEVWARSILSYSCSGVGG